MKLILKHSVLPTRHGVNGTLFATLLISGSVLHGATYFSENFDTNDTAGLITAGWELGHNAFAFETGTDFVLAQFPYDPVNYSVRRPDSSFLDPVTLTTLVTPPTEDGTGSSLTNGGYLISDSDAAGGSDNIGSLSEFWAITPSFST